MILHFFKCLKIVKYFHLSHWQIQEFTLGGQTKIANQKLRAKPESRARSAQESRAKPESRARSARELRAKPEPRAKPEKKTGEGSGEPLPRKFFKNQT